jgi:outer membrane protein OmpA-like peptidoglycan-associated protein
MKSVGLRALWSVLLLPVCGTPVYAGSGLLAGVDLGAVKPKEAYERFSEVGGVFSPFAGYMFCDYFGLMAQGQVAGTENKNRSGVFDDDASWFAGAGAGPRIAIPLREVELYGTGQAGIFSGLTPHGSVTDTSWGYSAGGGINIPVMHQVKVGAFGRYNRLFQRVHGVGDVKYITGGIGITFDLREAPPPPPKAPEVAAAAPPPPPAPAPVEKKKIVLRGVNFDFDQSDLRADARPVLDEAVATLKQEGTIAIVTEGHTDAVGTDGYNQALSLRRANAVRDYLVAGGIDAARIEVEGYGESRPVASNGTADGRAQNRRVELRVSGE